jgi:hypothetical protein
MTVTTEKKYRTSEHLIKVNVERIPTGSYPLIFGIIGVLAIVVMSVLAVVGVIKPGFLEFMGWCAAPGVAGVLAFYALDSMGQGKMRRKVHDRLTNGLSALIDSSSLPTKAQTRALLKKQTPIPITISGVSGALIVANFERVRGDDGTYVKGDLQISFATDMPDDGLMSFQRLLNRSVDNNEDMQRALDVVLA